MLQSDLFLRSGKAEHISRCLELGILLEVSVNKPGNVNFVVGFEGTRVEHFLASAVVAAPSFMEAAKRGMAVSDRKLFLGQVGVGEIIEGCVGNIDRWQRGGNTLLGTIMLLVPLAVAAGMTPSEGEHVYEISPLRKNLSAVVKNTTSEDAVHLYEAIGIAKPSGLNGVPELDVNDPDSKRRILRENLTLFDVFKIAAGYDDICYEWVNTFPLTFDLAFPYLKEQLMFRDLNTSVTHAFLRVLSERPDTFVARKVGINKAREISCEAREILEAGGVETQKGRKSIFELDKKLRNSGNLLNPGTTADIIAAALALVTLMGYRP